MITDTRFAYAASALQRRQFTHDMPALLLIIARRRLPPLMPHIMLLPLPLMPALPLRAMLRHVVSLP